MVASLYSPALKDTDQANAAAMAAAETPYRRRTHPWVVGDPASGGNLNQRCGAQRSTAGSLPIAAIRKL